MSPKIRFILLAKVFTYVNRIKQHICVESITSLWHDHILQSKFFTHKNKLGLGHVSFYQANVRWGSLKQVIIQTFSERH